MSDQDERGVSLRELRTAVPPARTDAAQISEKHGSLAVAPREAPTRETSVPSDIVARAKAAMRQSTYHPTSVADTGPEPKPETTAGDESQGEDVLDVRDQLASPSGEAGDPSDGAEPGADVDDGVEASAAEESGKTESDEQEKVWGGYNPDYVADQLVPMIHARATTGWRGVLGLQPSKAEQLRKRRQAEMCVNFGRPVKIVLVNPRGYAGKTTMSICLAGALGLARGGGVCAFENHELRGTMALRTISNGTKRTTRDFINDLAQITPEQVRHADLSRYVRHQHAGNFDAMVTSRSFEKQLEGREFRDASKLLERFYDVVVIDTANNEAHEAFQAAVEEATVLVVPIKWRPTHITPAAQMLNDMAGRSERHRLLVENAVVVASNGENEAVFGAREMALPMFSSLAHTVIEIPSDPHIEADRPILHDQLRPATRRALDEFGAAVCRVAVNNLNALEELK